MAQRANTCKFGNFAFVNLIAISDRRSDLLNIDGGFIVWKISTICVKILPNPLTHENRKTLLNTSILDLIAWNEYFSIGRLSLKFNLSQTLFFSFWHRWYLWEEGRFSQSVISCATFVWSRHATCSLLSGVGRALYDQTK